jgi:Domain of unknown function (DUF4397)
MRIRFLSAAAAALGFLTGCDSTVEPVETQLAEATLIRYVNAVPDTSSFDFRFVDGSIEGSPQFANVPFRTFTAYQRARPGQRQIKIFTNPSAFNNDAAVATQVHIDTTFTFEPNARYTIISYGFSRATSSPRHRLVILRDELPTNLTATQVGVRTIHAAAGVGNVDVYVQNSENAAGVTGAPTAANVAPLGTTAYLSLNSRPTTAPGTLTYRWDLTAPGSTTPLTVNPNSGSGLLGVAGTPSANPLAGFQVGRSVITAIVFAPSVTGSRATVFAAPGLRFLPDRHLDTTEQ